jgi:chaperonin GroES
MAKADSQLTHIQPAAGYLFIEPEEQAKQTTSGIYLPDTSSGEKPQTGTVLAVGSEEITDTGVKKPAPAKKGDRVIYKKWGGNEVKIENKEYLFVKAEDILAVLN